MEIDPKKWILIAGSMRDRSADETSHFEMACKSIGTALAEWDFGVISGSYDPQTADRHVLLGALKAGAEARVIRPKSVTDSPDDGVFRDVPLETYDGDWKAIRQKQVDQADGILLIGGESGTADVFHAAMQRNQFIPILLLPTFGGFAEREFQGLRETYLKRNVPINHLANIEKWCDATPEAVAELLQYLLDQDAAAIPKRQSPQPNQDSGFRSSSLQSAEPDVSHATYLLTWDPTRFAIDGFPELVRAIETQGEVESNWSVGRSNVAVGDRVFFMRHGNDRPGLIGSGQIVSAAYEGPHWDPNKPSDWKSNYADVRWDALGEFPLVPLDELIVQTGEHNLWTKVGSGLSIQHELAERLEAVWKSALTRKANPPSPATQSSSQTTAEHHPNTGDSIPVQKSGETTIPRAWVESDAIPVIGDLSHFRASQHDSLDVKEQAEIFATLMIAKDVKPPFALGLLGDWGVGKSFFMRLMQEKVAAIAGKDAHSEESIDSVSRVAQIEFNAWHYVDSDLWASLASRIFDGLADELKTKPDEIQNVRLKLRGNISSSQEEQAQASAAIAAAQDARKEATKALSEKQSERASAATKSESQRLQRVWDAVVAVKPDPSDPARKDWPDLADLKSKAEDTAKQLGITDGITNASEALRVYGELKAVVRRGSSLRLALGSAFTGRQALLSIACLLLMLGLVLGWPWILERVTALMDLTQPLLLKVLAPLLQLSTVVGALTVWASKNTTSISAALRYLERIRDELNSPRLHVSEPGKEESSLKTQIDKLDGEIASEQRRVEEADRRIAAAQAEIQRINSGGLVYDFLDQRVSDTRYLGRLGIISVIRGDFEKLGALLRDWQNLDANGAANTSPERKSSQEARPIERIILYIDDLDRCPPHRVVEILQAIHLLLAFDLFVVVVAVDARWLERSLNEAYNQRAPSHDDSVLNGSTHRFSAHNYLEKIFQIPFTLPAMNEEGFAKLVTAITATPRRQLGEQVDVSVNRQSQKKSGAPLSKVNPVREPVGLTEAIAEMTVNVSSSQQPSEQADGQQSQEEREHENLKQQEQLEARINAMVLSSSEEQFISALFPFIATPRLAKRFVNIYRLLRVRASSRDNFSKFIERESGEYRAVLMLLAIGVGNADVAPEILDDLDTANGASFRNWFKEKGNQYEKERLQLNSERVAQNEAGAARDRENRLIELRNAIRDIESRLDLVTQRLKTRESPPFGDDLRTYSKWARDVGRYSFRWHPKSSNATRPQINHFGKQL